MEEPVFNTLRTKEQLGYKAFNMMRYNFGVLGFSVTVNTEVDKFRYVLVSTFCFLVAASITVVDS